MMLHTISSLAFNESILSGTFEFIKINSFGIKLVIVTLCAVFIPLFLTVIVQFIKSPKSGLVVFATTLISKSQAGLILIDDVALLLSKLKSCSLHDTLAELVKSPVETTLRFIQTIASPDLSKSPREITPFA